MFKKLASPLLALMLAFGTVATSAHDAEAGRGRNIGVGIAAGIIGLGILGAYANARDRDYYYSRGPECYRGPEQCGWVNRRCFENRYGDTVCRGGRWTCWRDTVCD